MILRSKPAVASAAFVLAVLGGARVAHAGECAIDDDCGHGFECETIAGGTGGAGGTAGSGSSVGGSSSGGSSAGAAGAATGGAGFAPPSEVTCGDGLCQTPETAASCALDCANTVCVLAVCETMDDCADGYECEAQPLPGTGGAAGSTCGDGLCTSGETAETCAADCTTTSRCTPAGGLCSSDAQCADGFYCSFLGSGTGGGSASGSTGAGGFAGTSGSSSGGAAPASGGASGSSGSASGGTTGGTGSGSDAALAAGTCMPREEGAGGTAGTAGVGSGGAGAGGVGSGGTGFGGSGALGGTTSAGGSVSTGGTGNTAGTDNGGTGGGGGTSGSATGGTGTGGTGTGTGGTASGEDPGSVERGGCSLARPQGRSSFAELGALLLLAASVIRRRRPR
jgi:hypothetical protein